MCASAQFAVRRQHRCSVLGAHFSLPPPVRGFCEEDFLRPRRSVLLSLAQASLRGGESGTEGWEVQMEPGPRASGTQKDTQGVSNYGVLFAD